MCPRRRSLIQCPSAWRRRNALIEIGSCLRGDGARSSRADRLRGARLADRRGRPWSSSRGSRPRSRYIGADQCTWPRARFQRQRPQRLTAPRRSSLGRRAVPAARAPPRVARYQRPPPSSASTKPGADQKLISRLASRRQPESAASIGLDNGELRLGVRHVAHGDEGIACRRSESSRRTPASAPNVVSGCCGPTICEQVACSRGIDRRAAP